jgi:hypothetical protein
MKVEREMLPAARGCFGYVHPALIAVVGNRSLLALCMALLALTIGCSTTNSKLADKRLIGTWRSNAELTLANLYRQDPRWTNAPPARLEQLRSLFGRMTITFGKGTITAHYNAKEQQLGYEVVEHGPDYVLIQVKGGSEDGQRERLRFVDGDKGYWIQSLQAPEIEERFDKISP